MTSHENLDDADVICTTPEKLGRNHKTSCEQTSSGVISHTTRHRLLADAITRKRHDQGGMRFFAEVSLCTGYMPHCNHACAPTVKATAAAINSWQTHNNINNPLACCHSGS